MTAVRKILIEEEPVVAETVARAPVAKLYLVSETPAEAEETGSALKNALLFLVSPFIGLVYFIALPFVGLGVLAVLAGRTLAKIEAARTVGLAAKAVGLAVAAPFVGLAYAICLPFIGLGTLVWLGGRAAVGAAR